MAKDKGDEPLADWEKEKIARNQARTADLREQGATLGEVFSYDPTTTDGAAAVSTFAGIVEAQFRVKEGRVTGGKARGRGNADRDRKFRQWAEELRDNHPGWTEGDVASWIERHLLPNELKGFKRTAAESVDLGVYEVAADMDKKLKSWPVGAETIRKIIRKR